MSHEHKLVSRDEAIEAGAPRFFTGEPCVHGHVSERWTMGGACIECARVKREALQERYAAAKARAE